MSASELAHVVPMGSLVIDQRFTGLFIEEPATIDRITRDMQKRGFDLYRPLDIWRDGDGPGRHVLVEGHQRYQAAQKAKLKNVPVAYRTFDSANHALLWAAEQQANRRNASKEAQCLSILRALQKIGERVTTASMAERFGFSTATVDRARQVLKRGKESELMAVLDGTMGLKAAYTAILARERAENEKLKDPKPPPDDDHDDDLDDIEIEDPDTPELLLHARDRASELEGRTGRLLDILGADDEDAMNDIKRGLAHEALIKLNDFAEELKQILDEIRSE